MEKYTTNIITIVVNSDIDPSTLLDIANEAAARIVGDIESCGEEARFLEEETSVEQGHMIAGGE